MEEVPAEAHSGEGGGASASHHYYSAAALPHGSDSGSVPENVGDGAYDIRQVLPKVLTDYRGHYGWTDRETMARNALSENARRVYGIGV
jgi:hypothetical protein